TPRPCGRPRPPRVRSGRGARGPPYMRSPRSARGCARTLRGAPPRCGGSRPACGRSRTGSPGPPPRERMLPFAPMRVMAISDLHGAADHLEAAARECDVLFVLGDLINVLDYRTMDGILVEVFGREPVATAAILRSEGRFEEARAAIRRHATEEVDTRRRFLDLARAEYERVFRALPERSYVTFGNVDIPDLLPASTPDRVPFADGDAVRIGRTALA